MNNKLKGISIIIALTVIWLAFAISLPDFVGITGLENEYILFSNAIRTVTLISIVGIAFGIRLVFKKKNR